jgi:hypothetical protein
LVAASGLFWGLTAVRKVPRIKKNQTKASCKLELVEKEKERCPWGQLKLPSPVPWKTAGWEGGVWRGVALWCLLTTAPGTLRGWLTVG